MLSRRTGTTRIVVTLPVRVAISPTKKPRISPGLLGKATRTTVQLSPVSRTPKMQVFGSPPETNPPQSARRVKQLFVSGKYCSHERKPAPKSVSEPVFVIVTVRVTQNSFGTSPITMHPPLNGTRPKSTLVGFTETETVAWASGTKTSATTAVNAAIAWRIGHLPRSLGFILRPAGPRVKPPRYSPTEHIVAAVAKVRKELVWGPDERRHAAHQPRADRARAPRRGRTQDGGELPQARGRRLLRRRHLP